jgi:glycerol-3-phosphate acyltransferase PlsY
MIVGLFFAAVLIGYLLGSVPCGLLITRRFTRTDLRQVGSGKIGMTNVLRTAGKKAAVLSLLLDMAKAALSVILAGMIFRNNVTSDSGNLIWLESAQVLAALAAIGGHTWSVFLKFKGGRGVATFIGGLFALYWPAGVVGGALMLIIGFRTKYMSMGSIIGGVTAFIMLMALNVLRLSFFYLGPYPPIEYVTFAMIGSIFIYIMHRDNIIRLFNGTERKIGDKVKAKASPSSNNPD